MLCFNCLTVRAHLLCRSESNSFAGDGWGAMDFFPLSPNDSTVRCYEGWVLMSWLCNAGEDALQQRRGGGIIGQSSRRCSSRQGKSRGHYDHAMQGVRRTQLLQSVRQSCGPTKLPVSPNGGPCLCLTAKKSVALISCFTSLLYSKRYQSKESYTIMFFFLINFYGMIINMQ